MYGSKSRIWGWVGFLTFNDEELCALIEPNCVGLAGQEQSSMFGGIQGQCVFMPHCTLLGH